MSEIVKVYNVSFEDKKTILSFLSMDENVKKGVRVVAETPRGIEIGEVTNDGEAYTPSENEALTFIIKIADEEDFKIKKANEEECINILPNIQKECDKLDLNMRVIKVEYTLDRTKLLISYLSDERVDFRELLKVLAAIYHCRIDLRQIGARDKAKMIGGIGLCGLPLCCSTFLNEFDGISVTMAKNQMLALNIPKLSGQCGKLICCLKYEDATYTEEKKNLPRVGFRIMYNDISYKITSINILTKMVRLESHEGIENLPLSEVEKYLHTNEQAINRVSAPQKKFEGKKENE